MSQLTQKAIHNSFIKLLDSKPIDRITIKDITDDCGISRNTFYYHYADLPALVEEMLMDSAEERELLIEYYKCVSFGIIADWCDKGMRDDYSDSFKKLLDLRRKMLATDYIK